MRHMDEGLLQAWLDGPRAGLEPEERARVESHLAECPDCRARADLLRSGSDEATALLALTGAQEDEEIPDFDQVVARARDLGGRRRRLPHWVTLGWAASIAVALGAGWLSNEWMTPRAFESVLPASVRAPAEADRTEPAAVSGEPTAGGERSATAAGETEAETTPARASLPPPSEAQRTADPSGRVAGGEERAESRADQATRVAEAEQRADTGVGAATPVAEAAERIDSLADAVRLAELDAAAKAAVDPASDAAAPVPAAADPELPEGVFAAMAPVESVALTGRVRDQASGQPLRAAQVSLEGGRAGTLTDRDGRFLLLVPAPRDTLDRVTVQVDLVGYGTERRTLALSMGDSARADFELSAQAVALEELVVTGSAGAADTPRRAPSEPEAMTAVRQGEEAVSWRSATREEARALAGFPVRTVTGLEVVSVEVSTYLESPLVRVIQRLEEGARLTLLQVPDDGRLPQDEIGSYRDAMIQEAVVRLDDGVTVIARAPLPADVLRVLLGRLR